MQLNKPLHQATDAELHTALFQESKHVTYSYADIEGELERRRIKRNTTRSFVLSLVAVIVSGLSLLASVLIALYVRR